MPHFYVVEFTAERIADAVTIDIIPACWLIDEDKEECWYPRKNASSKVAKAMQPKTDGTWHRCPVKIMRSAGMKIIVSGEGDKSENVNNLNYFNLEKLLKVCFPILSFRHILRRPKEAVRCREKS